MDMSGQTALVTGGAGHIGRAIADTLLEAGCSVILVDRNVDLLEKYKKEREDVQSRIFMLVCDFEQEGYDEVVDDFIAHHHGKLDLLVNNAAFVGDSKIQGWAESFERQSVDTWRRALEVNLTSIFVLTQKLAKYLAHDRNGRVVNISSIYGFLGPDMKLYEDTEMGNPAAYSASKGGVIQLTRWLATTLAPGVRVNTVSPGGIERGQDQSFRKKYVAKVPLNRLGNEQDLVGAILFLGSDMSKYVTGQNIVVDGGYGTI